MKRGLALFAAMFLSCSMAQAAENTRAKDSFWGKMRSRIEQVTPKKKMASETVVGGVRGDQENGGSDLYWKGEEVKISATSEEIAAFQQALSLADRGEIEKAREAFARFVADYPDTALRAEAHEAMQLLAAGENQ